MSPGKSWINQIEQPLLSSISQKIPSVVVILTSNSGYLGIIMGNQASLIWGLLFGSIGVGYFLYGKKQKKGVPFICGIGLMIFPYMVSNTILLVIVGCLLLVIPYFVKY